MKRETESIVGYDIDFFPLETNGNIIEANALSPDWALLCPPSKLDYIMGNPPFIGARLMSNEQKDDLLEVLGPKWKNLWNLDYVSGWYKKAADFMNAAAGKSVIEYAGLGLHSGSKWILGKKKLHTDGNVIPWQSVLRSCLHHPHHNVVPFRSPGIICAHGVDAGRLQKAENAIPLFQRHSVQQLPLAVLYP